MYTVPLYEDLVAGVMKCVAVEIFYQTQRRLHPNLRRTLQQILFQTSTAPTNQNSPALPIMAPSPSTSPPTSTQSPPAATATASTAAAGTTAAIALRDVNVSAWRSPVLSHHSGGCDWSVVTGKWGRDDVALATAAAATDAETLRGEETIGSSLQRFLKSESWGVSMREGPEVRGHDSSCDF